MLFSNIHQFHCLVKGYARTFFLVVIAQERMTFMHFCKKPARIHDTSENNRKARQTAQAVTE